MDEIAAELFDLLTEEEQEEIIELLRSLASEQ